MIAAAPADKNPKLNIEPSAAAAALVRLGTWSRRAPGTDPDSYDRSGYIEGPTHIMAPGSPFGGYTMCGRKPRGLNHVLRDGAVEEATCLACVRQQERGQQKAFKIR